MPACGCSLFLIATCILRWPVTPDAVDLAGDSAFLPCVEIGLLAAGAVDVFLMERVGEVAGLTLMSRDTCTLPEKKRVYWPFIVAVVAY